MECTAFRKKNVVISKSFKILSSSKYASQKGLFKIKYTYKKNIFGSEVIDLNYGLQKVKMQFSDLRPKSLIFGQITAVRELFAKFQHLYLHFQSNFNLSINKSSIYLNFSVSKIFVFSSVSVICKIDGRITWTIWFGTNDTSEVMKLEKKMRKCSVIFRGDF